jgi:hypothetical protein
MVSFFLIKFNPIWRENNHLKEHLKRQGAQAWHFYSPFTVNIADKYYLLSPVIFITVIFIIHGRAFASHHFGLGSIPRLGIIKNYMRWVCHWYSPLLWGFTNSLCSLVFLPQQKPTFLNSNLIMDQGPQVYWCVQLLHVPASLLKQRLFILF